MPPILGQDPLDALHAAAQHRWLDAAVTALLAACDPWTLALVGLALYSWLEVEVPAVLRAAVPLALGLFAGAVLGQGARSLAAMPRPAGEGQGMPPLFLLGQALGGPMLPLATFSAYSLLVYGRRAAWALLLVLAAVSARALAGPHAALELAGGGALGALLGWTFYAAGRRLDPRGPLARRLRTP